RSPIDRGLLANIVKALASLKPKAVGFDIIIDHTSDPVKDAAFAAALKDAAFPVVLARLDVEKARTKGTDYATYHEDFLKRVEQSNPRISDGYVTLKVEADGIVRALPTRRPGDKTLTFSEALAATDGWKPLEEPGPLAVTRQSERIAWLQQPGTDATFLTIFAQDLLASPQQMQPRQRDLLDLLKDRLVIVGVKFRDPTDRHRTPFSKADAEEMSGAEINAQMLAQRIGKQQNYYELTLT